MLILAIESATDAAGVAIADESGTIAYQTVSRGRRHAETITPAISSCCEVAGLKPRDLDVVVVDVGPGLFTGLRVGIATAKGLAYALGLPMVAVNSLDVLATAATAATAATTATAAPVVSAASMVSADATVPVGIPRGNRAGDSHPYSESHPSSESRSSAESSDRDSMPQGFPRTRVIAVLDARRGEVVSAEFSLYQKENSHQPRKPDPGGSPRDQTAISGANTLLVRLSDDQLETSADLAGRLSNSDRESGEEPPRLLVGDGALRYMDILAEVPGVRIGPRWLAAPPVNVLAEIGTERAFCERFDDPADVLPRYVRQADTRINWSIRAPRPAQRRAREIPPA